ncbi:MAG: hypothetical protein GXN94_04935, partial [Aquificae bacterium]|nr:hypothetical protein [Aquificota bacterium]
VNGTVNFGGEFDLYGLFKGKNLKLKNLSLQDFRIAFNGEKRGEKLYLNLGYSLGKGIYSRLTLEGVNGRLTAEGKERLEGKITVEAEKGKSGVLELIKPVLNSSFSVEKGVITADGRLDALRLFLKKIRVEKPYSTFSLKREKGLVLEGKFFAGKLQAGYRLEKGILTVSVPELQLEAVAGYLDNPVWKELKGSGKGSVVVNIPKKKTSLDFSFTGLSLFGIKYSEGKLEGQVNNGELSGSYSLSLKNGESKASINGNFVKNSIKGDLSFERLDLSQLVFAERFNFGGLVNGKGKFEGKLPDFKVNITGKAESFFYKRLVVRDFDYRLVYTAGKKLMELAFNGEGRRIDGQVKLAFKPFSLSLLVNMDNANTEFSKPFLKELLPAVFTAITPLTASGKVELTAEKGKWHTSLDIKNSKVLIDPAGDYLYGRFKGFFSKEERRFSGDLWRENFRLKDRTVSQLDGTIKLQGSDLKADLKAEGLSGFEKMVFTGRLNGDLKEKHIKGKAELKLQKGNFLNRLETDFGGHFDSINGLLVEKGYREGKEVLRTKLRYGLSYRNKTAELFFTSPKLEVVLPEDFTVQFFNISGSFKIPSNPKSATGVLSVNNFAVSKNYIYLFDSSPLEMRLENLTITAGKVDFSGIIKGSLEGFEYSITNNHLKFFSKGKVDRNLLSIFLKYANASGDLLYSLSYDGKLSQFEKNLNFQLHSENLGLKTAYTMGILEFKKFLVQLFNGSLTVQLSGKSPDVVLGESLLELTGSGSLLEKRLELTGKTQFLPVKYLNVFQGNLNSQLHFKLFKKENLPQGKLSGNVSLSGKVRIEKDLEKMVKSRQKAPSSGREELERIDLDLKVESYIPVYLYGRWGKAYAELDLQVDGTAAKPVVNGEISIIYGEIFFMKNRYSVDFANIKIIQNEPYISARVSTSIADTFIFIDLSGSAYNPRINFSSSPPKSKDEILSILLLRDTPSALENMPVFKTIGKILYAILPFKSSEERGLFNTGFEINILPQYSPTAGISASLYAKRNLTRRIFIALSTPIGQVEEEKRTGWYGFGIRLRERTSFQYKFFETGNQEFDIVFNLPFDF